MRYGDLIGGIYQRYGKDGEQEWYLHEGKITKIVENSRGIKVYSKAFCPLNKDDIELNMDMSKVNGYVLVREVCLLTDELRDKFIKWIEYANAHPGQEKSIWSEMKKNEDVNL